MRENVLIISGGSPVDPAFFNRFIKKTGESFVICCDGGSRHLEKPGIRPDVIIGDMDSIDPAELKNYSASGIKIIKYPAGKDSSDTGLALDYALGLKPKQIFILCALGGRIDHTLANVFLLCRALEKGIRTSLVDEYCEAFVLDKNAVFEKEKGKTVSLLALTAKATGITLSGFLYPLKRGTIRMGESRGISNIIKDDRAKISMESGKLLVIKYRRKNFFPKAI